MLLARVVITTCAIAGPAIVLAQEKKSGAKSVEGGINAAFASKDAAGVGKYLASIYNEGGVSKDELVRQLSALFKAGTVQVQYRVLDFHQFPGKKTGYFRTSTEMSVGGANAAAKQLKTAGYASAIQEGGQWRILATQPAACPHVRNLNVASERGDWVGWGSQLNPAGLGAGMLPEAERPTFAFNDREESAIARGAFGFAPAAAQPKFDRAAWERRFENAWNSKNAQELLSFYSADYNEFGLDKAAVTKAVHETLKRFDTIVCKYRVVGIRFFPGTKLASIKAAIDIQGRTKGSTTSTPILQVAGYASLMAEGGAWKVYATQLFTTPGVGPENVKLVSTSDWPPQMDVTVSR